MRAKDGNRTAELSADPALVTGMQGVMSIAKSKMGQMTEEGAGHSSHIRSMTSK